MVVRKIETFSPVTIRGHGCRDLLIYCGSGRCHHGATMNGDWLPDEAAVRSLCGQGKYSSIRSYTRFLAASVASSLARGHLRS
jgi:hypothetical protein